MPSNGKVMRSCIGTAVLLLGTVWHSGAQPAAVSLNLVATNKQGGPVTDLKPDDLKVLEDGRPQPIVFFRANDNRRPAPAGLGPYKYTNRPPGTPSGVTLVIFHCCPN